MAFSREFNYKKWIKKLKYRKDRMEARGKTQEAKKIQFVIEYQEKNHGV